MRTPNRFFRLVPWAVALAIIILLGGLALSSTQAPGLQGTAGTQLTTPTPTPTPIPSSEIGSTSGLVVLIFLIVGVIILPIIRRWREWLK